MAYIIHCCPGCGREFQREFDDTLQEDYKRYDQPCREYPSCRE